MIEFKCGACPEALEFDMQLNGGAVGATPEVTFFVQMNGYMIGLPCTKGDHGMFTVKLGLIDPALVPGELPIKIQVVLGDHVFYPYTDTMTIKPADPKPAISAVNKVEEPQIVPQVTTVQTVAPTPTPPTVTMSCESLGEAKKPEPMVPANEDVEMLSALLSRKR